MAGKAESAQVGTIPTIEGARESNPTDGAFTNAEPTAQGSVRFRSLPPKHSFFSRLPPERSEAMLSVAQ